MPSAESAGRSIAASRSSSSGTNTVTSPSCEAAERRTASSTGCPLAKLPATRRRTGWGSERAISASRCRSRAASARWTLGDRASRSASAPARSTRMPSAAVEARSAAASFRSVRSTPFSPSARSTAHAPPRRTAATSATATAAAAPGPRRRTATANGTLADRYKFAMDNRRPVRLYNTLSRRLDELPPPGPIRMYVCGSTVYHRVHVGNARPFVLGLWLKRWLERGGYDVTLVHNITDVDDHIYEEAAKQEIPSRELARRATEWLLEDTDDLGLGRPDAEPKASDTISEIIAFVEELIRREFAYQANGDVYFRVARDPEYGKLSGAKLDEMVAQEPSDVKQDQRDFALWKGQKPHEDFAWDSPWGPGRPGWHIECTAMAERWLGPVFELHGGGLDLRFPHHENELAQARAAGHEFAKVWMHNGLLQFTGSKMSKSEGNVVTLRDALDRWGRETLLLYFIRGHWSKPIEFSDEAMDEAAAQLSTFRDALLLDASAEVDEDELAAALADDFNTPEALAILHRWRAAGANAELRRGLELFGISAPLPD